MEITALDVRLVDADFRTKPPVRKDFYRCWTAPCAWES